MDAEDEWQSGPWCFHHYRAPDDCEECSVRCGCGHRMDEHDRLSSGKLCCTECDCEEFAPRDEST